MIFETEFMYFDPEVVRIRTLGLYQLHPRRKSPVMALGARETLMHVRLSQGDNRTDNSPRIPDLTD